MRKRESLLPSLFSTPESRSHTAPNSHTPTRARARSLARTHALACVTRSEIWGCCLPACLPALPAPSLPQSPPLLAACLPACLPGASLPRFRPSVFSQAGLHEGRRRSVASQPWQLFLGSIVLVLVPLFPSIPIAHSRVQSLTWKGRTHGRT